MTSAKVPGRSVTRSANWLKCAHTSVALPKRSAVRNASRTSTTVDREPERPGQLRDRRRVVSGAEDHELGRRHRDFVEDVRAAHALGTRRRIRRPQARAGTRDRPLLDDRIGQPSDDVARAANDHPARHAGERRDQHGRLAAFEHRQPLVRDRIVVDALDADVDGAAAADAQAPDRIVGQVVAHDDRLAGRDDARRRLGNRRFQAAARQRAFVGAVPTHEHPRAFAAVGAALDAHHRGQRRRLAGRARLADRVEEPFGLAPIHRITMAQPGRAGNRLSSVVTTSSPPRPPRESRARRASRISRGREIGGRRPAPTARRDRRPARRDGRDHPLNAFEQRVASATVFPFTLSVMSDADAVAIAQPSP